MRRDRLIMLLGLGCACDFGVDLTGLSDGASEAAIEAGPDAPMPSVAVVALGLGVSHSCGVRVDGSVVCWGSNSNGQLGNGTTVDSSLPVAALGLMDATQVAGGQYHTCAVERAGTVKCWGSNGSNQLGTSVATLSQSTVPVAVPTITNATQVAATASSTCAVLMGGSVSCWGSNGYGQLGIGNMPPIPGPQPVPGLTGVTTIRGASDGNHFCALTTAGAVWCWGQNTNGQIGNNQSNNNVMSPAQPTMLAAATDIATGTSHSCAVVGGAVWCFGLASSGQLGNGQTMPSPIPTPVQVENISGAVNVSAGSAFSCATTSTGVSCWGAGAAGQLGNGMNNESLMPVTVQSGPVTAIGSGILHTCALLPNGAVECWGFNGNGRLGLGNALLSSTPIHVNNLPRVVELAVGGDHSCASAPEAGIVCWGDNGSGQVGTSSSTLPATSVPLVATTLGLSGLSAGASHTCAVSDGGAYCFGSNYWGQFGNGTTSNSASPTRFGDAGFGASAVVAGNAHSCTLADAGTVWCAGENPSGQLGDNSTSNSAVATIVDVVNGDAGLSGVKSIAAGASQSCAETATSLLCWGNNGSGQLGVGNKNLTDVATPVTVLGDAGLPLAIAIGGSHTCIIRSSDGAVLCWGAGSSGQLGNMLGMDSTTPVQAMTNGAATSIAAGSNHACAVLANHQVQCWGSGGSGALGNGGTTNAYVPALVTGITTAVAVRASGSTTCALLMGGAVACWGANPDGQLADGAPLVIPSPSFVMGL